MQHLPTQAAAAQLLRYQRCDSCHAAQTLQRYACTQCGSARLHWEEASGRGTVYAVTEVSRAPSDAFRSLVPYTLVLVDFDEGIRLMGHAERGLQIGDRVAATFFQHESLHLVRFVRAGAQDS